MEGRTTHAWQVFLAFLKQGCTCFGGPVAHLGFFQNEFVRKRKWVSEREYADTVALCQFLPGPASSQVCLVLGYEKAGKWGAAAAWTGFILPSALLMILFAYGFTLLPVPTTGSWLQGLKIAAVAVVANAIWNMAGSLCPDRERALLALCSAAFLLVVPGAGWQVMVILAGLLVGWRFFRTKKMDEGDPAPNATKYPGWPWLAAFFLLLALTPLAARAAPETWLDAGAQMYRAGSLVFGGGHVILPLLDGFTVARGWVDRDTFLAGYGAAQALPGPLFAFTGFLGFFLTAGPGGIAGGCLALLAVSLPSWLLVAGAYPYWQKFRTLVPAQAALLGANAAVVGLLLAAFFGPVWSAAIHLPADIAFALAAFALLRFLKLSPAVVVGLCGLTGLILF